MAIIGRKTVIVSPDKSKGLETMINDYCGIFGTNCILKKEGELAGTDLSKDLLLIGVLTDFESWKSFKAPVTLLENGFLINNKKFQDELDGFVLIDSNRIIIGGNSLKAVKDAQLALTGGHDILITQKGKITFFGNKKGIHFDWFNLQDLKAILYNRKASTFFSNVHISKLFKDTIDYSDLERELKDYVQNFLSIYKIKMPLNRPDWFLHSNMQEYGTMSGMFGLTCPGNNSAGFSIRGEIHTRGYNVTLVKHEYSHFLFDNTISQENNPAFFVEGCVEYVTNINDTSLFKQRISIAKMYRDSLNYADLIISNKDFYAQYAEANYSVCGVLVKYIVDNYGVNNFKKYCLAKNKDVSTKEIFNKDFDELIKEYKIWLDKH